MKKLERSGEYCSPLEPQDIQNIWDDALRVLAECGVEMADDDALAVLQKNGAKVDGNRVRFDAAQVHNALDSAPAAAVLCARNHDQDVTLGSRETVCSPLYGATHILLPDGTKRAGTLADLEMFHKASQAADMIQNVGSNIIEPTDIPARLRHLYTMRSVLVNSDKSFMPVTSSRDADVAALGLAGVRAQDSVDMARIALGTEFERGPCMIGVATCTQALTWAGPALDAIRIFAQSGQAIILAPFAVVGKNAAAEPSALLTQILAEILAGLIYSQAIRPGTSILFGPHFAIRDDCSHIPQAATDLMLAASGQLARHIGLPFRASGGLTNGVDLDANSGAEALGTITASLAAGAHFLFHGAGWLENGLTVSQEKFDFDCKLLTEAHFRQSGLTLAPGGVAGDMLRGWGPERDHLSDPATISVMNENYGVQQGNSNNEAIPLHADVIKELDAFVEKRSQELMA